MDARLQPAEVHQTHISMPLSSQSEADIQSELQSDISKVRLVTATFVLLANSCEQCALGQAALAIPFPQAVPSTIETIPQ
jgi:hypothetical protein